MSNKYSVRSPLAAVLTGAALCLVGALAVSRPGYTDDRDLLRFSSAKPYLFFILDTSSSMNFAIGSDTALIGGGDNPGSRIYAAKQALYNVFSTVDDVHFGFASFNQDGTRVRAKHYLYYNDTALPAAAAWPLPFPAQDANGLTQYVDQLNLTGADVIAPIGTPDAVDGVPETVVADIQGDALTIGPLFDLNGNGLDAADQEAGSCASPLPLGAIGSEERVKIQTFALLNTSANPLTTTLWISNGGQTYRLRTSLPATKPDGTANSAIGADNLAVLFQLDLVTACPATFTAFPDRTILMRQDPRFNQYVMVDTVPDGGDDTEPTPGVWAWSDVISSATCTESKPFSGKGWEGNYDSDDTPPAGITLAAGYPQDVDRACVGSDCIELKPVTHTTYSAMGRALDRGDILPFDWNSSNRTALLQRLAPNVNNSSPVDFGTASHLQPSLFADMLEPVYAGRAPLIAVGNSPLSKSILDFRCWYTGSDSNKCGASATADVGWGDTACTFDPEFGCRRPYLILISDGGDNCHGENPSADTAGMNSKAGIQTWALNLGNPGCPPPLHSITQNGKGECVDVSDPEDLRETIAEILNKIREEARTFASAAVPSIQAVADQAIYLTDFTPLNNRSRWPGHVNSYLKPLPLTLDGRPDRSRECSGPDEIGCFTWDAGEVLVEDQTARYVYYAMSGKPGLWPAGMRELATTTDGSPEEIRYDLWRAFDMIAPSVANDSLLPALETALQNEANTAVTSALSVQSRSGCDPLTELCDYLLGDIFHSDPLVFGQPSNVTFQRDNEGADFNTADDPQCTANGEMSGDDDNIQFDRGYACYFARTASRRQVLFVGSNDGLVHAFNAAQYQPAEQRYDNGTGHELFAYMPRLVMPTVKQLTEGPEHHFTVDGAIQAFDAFIDPLDDNDGVNFPVAQERRWRTVLIGGLREGGRGYYALDVTQPDYLTGPEGGPFEPDDKGNANATPSCLLQYTKADCGPIPYGAPLWEFSDTTDNQKFEVAALQPALPVAMDEDGNDLPDLAESWPAPDLARIQICGGANCTISPDPATSADLEERFVAIFGGGMDVDHKTFDPRSASPTDPDGLGPDPSTFEISGHFLYIVDVETGEAIYKRQLCSPYRVNDGNPDNPCVPGGAAPSEVSAIDSDLNGYVDRIYVGTLGGYLYRVDLQKVVTVGGVPQIEVPGLEATQVTTLGGGQVTVMRIPDEDGGGNPQWNPYVIFDANRDNITPTTLPRPLFFRPAVLNARSVAAGAEFALALGTGDREDLWNAPLVGGQAGRFYVILDDTATNSIRALACGTLAPNFSCPLTENDLTGLTPTTAATSDNLLGDGGWFIELSPNERVITDTFSFSGVTYFATYRPQVALTDESGNPLSNLGTCGDNKFESNTTASCAKTGNSFTFLVNTLNGNGLLGSNVRSQQVSSFVTNPYTEFTTGSGSSDSEVAEGANADTMSQAQIDVMNAIQALFSPSCRFTNARVDINTFSADIKAQDIGSVPVCLLPHNWKEF
jgi:Tfp pilus tip-associated adhesin PilY1